MNAVATAVKDFFFKRLPPILEDDHMAELETISSKFKLMKFWEGTTQNSPLCGLKFIHFFTVIPDRSIKVLELGKLIKRLPKTNFAVLKFIFQHFVK